MECPGADSRDGCRASLRVTHRPCSSHVTVICAATQQLPRPFPSDQNPPKADTATPPHWAWTNHTSSPPGCSLEKSVGSCEHAGHLLFYFKVAISFKKLERNRRPGFKEDFAGIFGAQHRPVPTLIALLRG